MSTMKSVAISCSSLVPSWKAWFLAKKTAFETLFANSTLFSCFSIRWQSSKIQTRPYLSYWRAQRRRKAIPNNKRLTPKLNTSLKSPGRKREVLWNHLTNWPRSPPLEKKTTLLSCSLRWPSATYENCWVLLRRKYVNDVRNTSARNWLSYPPTFSFNSAL